MNAVAHNPDFAKKVGVPVSVGKDFSNADKREKLNNPKVNHGDTKYFKEGGSMATKKLFGGKESYSEEKKEAQALKSGKISTKQYIAGEKSEGHKEENVAKQARDIKSGKMSPTAYAKSEQNEYKCGGKVKRYEEGGKVFEDASDAGLEQYTRKGPGPKKLPSELIKGNDKPAFDKYVKEPFRKANDAASKFLESKGLTNPVDVIDEEFGGETVKEARARREGKPVSKGGSSFKSGGSVSSASRRGDGIAVKGKTRGKIY